AQGNSDTHWSKNIAAAWSLRPAAASPSRHARLFDPRDLSVIGRTSVVITGERVIRVGPDADVRAPADAEVIDAHGKFLMPGLWDNHQHFGDVDGALDLANGVTSARDMANDLDR